MALPRRPCTAVALAQWQSATVMQATYTYTVVLCPSGQSAAWCRPDNRAPTWHKLNGRAPQWCRRRARVLP